MVRRTEELPEEANQVAYQFGPLTGYWLHLHCELRPKVSII